METNGIYIGLMSGTSIDAVDALALKIHKTQDNYNFKILGSETVCWADKEKEILHKLCQAGNNEIETLSKAHILVAKKQALAVNNLVANFKIDKKNVIALGSHGQTIRHIPNNQFSLQLNNAALLADLTDIDVVYDFRCADLAVHGQGAPLTPIFHKKVLSSVNTNRFILNLGGISNITILNKKDFYNKEVPIGFDIGPANTLIDLACRQLFNIPYDKDASIASKGTINKSWLQELLKHPFFLKEFPKSTGSEDFNLDTIKDYLSICQNTLQLSYDLIRTLTELTIVSIVDCIKRLNLKDGELVLCGGGAKNPLIKEELAKRLIQNNIVVKILSNFKIDEQYFEAMAFAYFAYAFVNKETFDLHKCTGAQKFCLLGSFCPALNGKYLNS